ncbi:MAG TPA: KpsF/GutQ family sugar-phosphate isomerase [Telmatospirillum sp.]|nr:KpsF/GutQ family sugar-phosphate isomerase [Telmatospirillum sp.]
MTVLTPTPAVDVLAEGKRVLREEGQALLALAETIGPPFAEAIDKLLEVAGRIVVTGMGKSGLVGKKLAATFSSTGSPAFFLHPAEASHGDLGMLTGSDIVIALSASGESAELANIVSYCLRFAVPLIAITREPDSSLGRAATVLLKLPAIPEACPLQLAPTTSTTMMLALGDALSVTLMRRRGFTAERFHDFHPGGRLGHQLLQLRDVMHKGDELPIVRMDTLIREGIVVMTAKRFGCVGVLDDRGLLVGIFTDGDLRRCLDPTLLDRPVGSVMIKNPKRVSPDTFLADVARIMATYTIPSVFVTEDDRPVGIVHLHDLLKTGLL